MTEASDRSSRTEDSTTHLIVSCEGEEAREPRRIFLRHYLGLVICKALDAVGVVMLGVFFGILM
jgi:hypothetical protein